MGIRISALSQSWIVVRTNIYEYHCVPRRFDATAYGLHCMAVVIQCRRGRLYMPFEEANYIEKKFQRIPKLVEAHLCIIFAQCFGISGLLISF